MNYNNATIVGRVVRDPDVKTMTNGTVLAAMSVATSRKFTSNGEKKEEAEFHNVVAFGKVAEIISQYVKKGMEILISGRLQTRSWEKDGHKNYRTEIIVEKLQMGAKASNTVSAVVEAPAEATKEPALEEISIDDINF